MSEEQQKAEGGNDMLNVDLLDLMQKVGRNWRVLFAIVAVFVAIALFHTKFGPTEYESTSILIQESDAGGGISVGGDLFDMLSGGVSSSGGIAAAASGQTPPPLFLYPDIVNSSEFQYGLINRYVEFEHLDKTLTLYEYFTEYNEKSFRDRVYSIVSDYTIKLPFTLYDHLRDFFRAIGRLFSGPEPEVEQQTEVVSDVEEPSDERLLHFTSRELSVMNQMRTRILLEIGAGIITVTIRLPDPMAAAQINASLLEQMEEHLTAYRVEKAERNLAFAEEQYANAQLRYEEAQIELAVFTDQNQNINTERARADLGYLQDIRDARASVYNGLALEVERARLNVQRETPVFQVLEKPGIPTSPFTGLDNLMVIFAIILGLITGVTWIFTREAVRALYSRYRS